MRDVIRRFGSGRAIEIYFSMLVFLFLLADRLVWWDDILAINVNGWIGFFHGVFPLFILMLVPLLLLGSYARYFYIPFFFVEIPLQVVAWFARVNFRMVLDGDWVGIVLGSSPDELIWFLKHHAAVLLLLVVLLSGLLFGVWKLTILVCRSRATKTTVALGIGGILLFFYANQVLNSCVRKKFEHLEKQVFGVNLVLDTFRHWNEFKLLAAMKINPQMPNTVKLSESQPEDVLGVVILGESATRSHWGLYGYERDTTPCMNARKAELTVYEDLVTPIGSTAESMRYAFTTRTVERKNDLRFTMAQALKAVGYDVAMFSNQERWGEWESDESFDFAGCAPFLFMKEEGETNSYDEVLLPYLTNYLASVKGKAVVFLHLRGSHVPSSSNYPWQDAPFEPEGFEHSGDEADPALTKNHYDNSIWYTDKVLERVICELESKRRPTWMIYFSDHGETPSSKSWRMQTDNDLWEIPFIVWTSSEFNERCPATVSALRNATKLALQSDQLFYGMLAFCGVEGLGNSAEEDFLNPLFKCRKQRKVQNGCVEYVRRVHKVGE